MRIPVLTFRLGALFALRGTVREADGGAPVPGAEVRCGKEVVEADATGRFEIRAPRNGNVSLSAEAEGFLPVSEMLDLRGGDAGGVEFLLERPVFLEGRVVAMESGVPLEGVAIENGRVETDAAGRFRWPCSPSSERFELRFDAEERCSQRVEWSVDELDAPVEVGLHRAALVEGAVRDEDGAAVPGAWVRMGFPGGKDSSVRPLLPPSARLEPYWRSGRATTDEDGSFRIERVMPGAPAKLEAGAEGFRSRSTDLGELAPGQERSLDVRLERVRRTAVRGSITWNGRPVRGSVAWNGPTEGGEEYLGEPADTYEITDLEPGRVTLVATARFGDGGDPRTEARREAEVEVPDEGAVVHDFVFDEPTGAIAGVVLHEDGTPVVGVEVAAEEPQGWWRFVATTDVAGGFELQVPAAPETYTLHVGSHALEGVRTGDREVRFVLEEPESGTVRFRVRRADTGELVPGPEVYYGGRMDRSLRTYAGVDPEGYYRSEAPAGSLELFCLQPGYVPARETLVVEVGATATVELLLERGFEVTFLLDEEATGFLRERSVGVCVLEEEFWAGVRFVSETNGYAERDYVELPPGLPYDLFIQRFVNARSGRGTITGLAPGRYRLELFPDTLRLEPERIVLEPDGPRAREVRLRLLR